MSNLPNTTVRDALAKLEAAYQEALASAVEARALDVLRALLANDGVRSRITRARRHLS